jgi:hypothetical protein
MEHVFTAVRLANFLPIADILQAYGAALLVVE